MFAILDLLERRSLFKLHMISSLGSYTMVEIIKRGKDFFLNDQLLNYGTVSTIHFLVIQETRGIIGCCKKKRIRT